MLRRVTIITRQACDLDQCFDTVGWVTRRTSGLWEMHATYTQKFSSGTGGVRKSIHWLTLVTWKITVKMKAGNLELLYCILYHFFLMFNWLLFHTYQRSGQIPRISGIIVSAGWLPLLLPYTVLSDHWMALRALTWTGENQPLIVIIPWSTKFPADCRE